MEDKRPWQSRTIVSAFVGIGLAWAIGRYPETFSFLGSQKDSIVDLVMAATFGLVYWGRTKADRPVTLRKR